MEWQDGQERADRMGDAGQPGASGISGQHGSLPAVGGLPSGLLQRLRSRITGRSKSSVPASRPDPATLAALESANWSERAAAVQTLGTLDNDAPLDLLAHALQDEHEIVRATAARALGRLQHRAPLGHLLLALHDTSWHVRASAAQALGKLGKRVPIGPLIKLLGDEDESVRAAATGALGDIGDPAALKALQVALQDPAWHVREMAVLALGRFGDQAPPEDLARASQDREPLVREAVESLYETRPELFRTIMAARRKLATQHEHITLSPTPTPADAPDRHSLKGRVSTWYSSLLYPGPTYPRRGLVRDLRQLFIYSWCLILGYLGGCIWYLYQSPDPQQHADFPTLLSILTINSSPLRAILPNSLHNLTGLSLVLLLIAALWATLDSWREQQVLKRRRKLRRGPEYNQVLLQQQYANSPDAREYLFPPSLQDTHQQRAPSRRTILVSLLAIVLVGNALTWFLLLQSHSNVPTSTSASPVRHPAYSYPLDGSAQSLAWSSDSGRFATGGNDGIIQVRDAQTGEVLLTHTHAQIIFALAWSPNGQYIASGSSDGSIQVWNAITDTTVTTYNGHHAGITDLAWSPDSTHIISAAQDGTVQIWYALTGKRYALYSGRAHDAASVTWSPDGQYIAAAGLNDELWVREATTGAVIHQQTVKSRTDNSPTSTGHSLAWSPHPHSLALAYSDQVNSVQILRATDGTILHHYDEPGEITPPSGGIAWSPDGTRLAMVLHHTIVVRDVTSEQVLFSCPGDTYYLASLAWSPDGRYIAAANLDDPTLFIWQAL